jgi:hypothetical protein
MRAKIVVGVAAWVLLLLAFALTGCAQFDNRLVCTVAGDRAYVVSEYMRVGVSARLADKDRAAVCK